MEKPRQDRELLVSDLVSLGYSRDQAVRMVQLLSEEELLHHYVSRGNRLNCIPVTRVTEGYPLMMRQRLGTDSPGTLWAKGDVSLLNTPTISLVGSRELCPANHAFAEAVGRHAASQGLTLVSGNARGADRAAQEACLKHGGRVIAVVADALKDCPLRENVLYLSEEGFDLPFSAQRALQRNRIIHSFSELTFVVQCALGKGGTWRGTNDNLRHNWSQVVCFADGTKAAQELEQLGSIPMGMAELADLSALRPKELNFLD